MSFIEIFKPEDFIEVKTLTKSVGYGFEMNEEVPDTERIAEIANRIFLEKIREWLKKEPDFDIVLDRLKARGL